MDSSSVENSQGGRLSRAPRPWFQILPFVLSAGLFLSGVFSLFAPLPLLLLGVLKGPRWALLAGLLNAGLIYLVGGPALFQFFLIGVVLVSVVAPVFLRRNRARLETTFAWTWVAEMGAIVLLIIGYAIVRGHRPADEIQLTLGRFFDWLVASVSPENRQQLFGDLTPEDWRAQSMVELPMALLTVAAVSIWVNLNLLVSLMGRARRAEMGLDRKSFFRWKNGDWLVWPTIVVWAGFIFLEGTPGEIALGFFKFFMALYAIQGVAILATLFDTWKVRGLFRLMLYFFALFLMLPFVIAIGFFDQWFDFRAKLRQS